MYDQFREDFRAITKLLDKIQPSWNSVYNTEIYNVLSFIKGQEEIIQELRDEIRGLKENAKKIQG